MTRPVRRVKPARDDWKVEAAPTATSSKDGGVAVSGDGSKVKKAQGMYRSDTDITQEELQDFLDADNVIVQADPVFKEALRRELWSLVKTRFLNESDPTEH